jgi:hypothetical protein
MADTASTNTQSGTQLNVAKIARKVGSVVGKLAIALLILTVVWAIVTIAFSSVVVASSEASERNCVQNATFWLAHQRCRNSDGCGSDCPYTQDDDPRKAICQYDKELTDLGSFLDEREKMRDLYRTTMLDKFDEDKKSGIAGSISTELATATTALQNINVVIANAHLLSKEHCNSKTVSNEVLKVKTIIQTYAYAAGMNRYVYDGSCELADMKLRLARLDSLDDTQKARVSRFNAKRTECAGHVTAATNAYTALRNRIITNDTFDYKDMITKLSMPELDSDSIMKYLAVMMNMSKDCLQDVDIIITRAVEVYELYSKVLSLADTFSNDMPGEFDYNGLKSAVSRNDYANLLTNTALENDLVKNHKKYSKERASFDSGGAVRSVRDDDNDLIPWVGFSRPSYRHSNGTSADTTNGEALRSIPSDVPEDMMRTNTWRFSTSSNV